MRVILGCIDQTTARQVQSALAAIPGVTLTTTAPGLAILGRQIRDQHPDVCLVDATLLDGASVPQGRSTAWIAFGRARAPKDRPACPWLELAAGDADLDRFRDDLARTLRAVVAAEPDPAAAAELAAPGIDAPAAAPRPHTANRMFPGYGVRAVGVAVSTGGPEALRALLGALPATFAPPILITQHIPAEFSASLARSLDKATSLAVSEARHREAIEPGRVYLAPGGLHMEATGTLDDPRIRLHDAPPELAVRPNANVMLRSMASVFGSRMVAVVMTGMGCDGQDGCSAVRGAGGRILVQDAASCVVYGMPRAVVEAGLADEVIALEDLGRALCRAVGDSTAAASLA